jgi:YfiH family protein
VSAPPFASLNLALHVGDSEEAVWDNRRRVLRALGLAPTWFVEAEQVHGAEVAVIGESWFSKDAGERCVAAGADALVTSLPDVALSLYFADCVPVFLAEPTGRVVGLAHAGWRGTARGVAPATLRTMCVEFDLAPSEVVAIVGPCVGLCCYEVGDRVMQRVAASLPPNSDVGAIARRAPNASKWLLDLAAANIAQLENAGVPAGTIESIGRCTCCEREVFFSARGDGPLTGRCGALAYIAGPASAAAGATSRGACVEGHKRSGSPTRNASAGDVSPRQARATIWSPSACIP